MKYEPKVETLQRVDGKRARGAATRSREPHFFIGGTAFPHRTNGPPSVHQVFFDRLVAIEVRMLQLDSGTTLQCFTRVDLQAIWAFHGHGSEPFVENIDHPYLVGLHVGACAAAAAQLGVNDLLD
jgi:hypothetical protein